MLSQNYFELFGLPAAYDITLKTLEKEYFSLQQHYHPDRFAAKPAKARAEAAGAALLINQAYQTLKNDLSRAQYILLQQGIRVNTDADTIKPSQQLLMEVMELQDTLQDIDNASLSKFIEQINAQMRACNEMLSNAFAEKDYARAADATLRLNYLTKISETARQKAFAADGV
jgi:molecular chaperone HscB